MENGEITFIILSYSHEQIHLPWRFHNAQESKFLFKLQLSMMRRYICGLHKKRFHCKSKRKGFLNYPCTMFYPPPQSNFINIDRRVWMVTHTASGYFQDAWSLPLVTSLGIRPTLSFPPVISLTPYNRTSHNRTSRPTSLSSPQLYPPFLSCQTSVI